MIKDEDRRALARTVPGLLCLKQQVKVAAASVSASASCLDRRDDRLGAYGRFSVGQQRLQTTTILNVLRPCGSRIQVRSRESLAGTTKVRLGGLWFFTFVLLFGLSVTH